jgi:hypothetical protein
VDAWGHGENRAGQNRADQNRDGQIRDGQIAGVDHHGEAGGAERGLCPETFDQYGLSFDHSGLPHASLSWDDVGAIKNFGGNGAIGKGEVEQTTPKTAPIPETAQIPNGSNEEEEERLRARLRESQELSAQVRNSAQIWRV